MTRNLAAEDVARAARLVAALAADDETGARAVLVEAAQVNDKGPASGLVDLALALAARHIKICSEYYDTDCQKILDTFAMDAMNLSE